MWTSFPRTALRGIVAVAILLSTIKTGILAVQQTSPASSSESRAVMQQLSELLEPVGVRVVAESMSAAGQAGTKELRVRWGGGATPAAVQVTPPASPPPPVGFSVAAQRKYSETSTRQRVIDVAPGRLLVAAMDRSGRLRSWTVIPDPRILRSEGPGPDGTLTGQTLRVDQAEFFLSLPDDPEIVECRFFEPQPSGKTYKVVSIGSIPVAQ